VNKYIANPKSSTSIFNFFRKFIRIPIFEKLIVKCLHYFPAKYLKKLVPPEYLYSEGSIRQVKRNDINYTLDISNLVDHYIYFGLDKINFTPVLASIQEAKVIFDIGANIGSTAMYFSQ